MKKILLIMVLAIMVITNISAYSNNSLYTTENPYGITGGSILLYQENPNSSTINSSEQNQYVNYTKPVGATVYSSWGSHDFGVGAAFTNTSFNSTAGTQACWNAYSDKLVLRFRNIAAGRSTTLECYDGSSWNTVSSESQGGGWGDIFNICGAAGSMIDGDHTTAAAFDALPAGGPCYANPIGDPSGFYEEFMWWNISAPVSLTEERLNFTDSYNFTRYLYVQNGTFITLAKMNFAGFLLDYYLNENPGGFTSESLTNTSNTFAHTRLGQNVHILNKTIDKIAFMWRCLAGNCSGDVYYRVRYADNKSIRNECFFGSANVSTTTIYRECDFTNFSTGNDNLIYTIELENTTQNTTDQVQIRGETADIGNPKHLYWGRKAEYRQNIDTWTFPYDSVDRYFVMNFTFTDGTNYAYPYYPSLVIGEEPTRLDRLSFNYISCFQEDADIFNQTGLDSGGACNLTYGGNYSDNVNGSLWHDGSYSNSDSFNPGDYAIVNYTLPPFYLGANNRFGIKTAGSSSRDAYCFNGTGYQNFASLNPFDFYYTLPDICVNQNVSYLSVKLVFNLGNTFVWEDAMSWNVSNVTIIDKSPTTVWNYSGTFNSTDMTNNFGSVISSYLSECYYDILGFCEIPFYFNIINGGMLRYFNMIFSNQGVDIITSNFTSSAYETDTENYSITIVYDPGEYPFIEGKLIYDGVPYTATKVLSGIYANFTLSLDVPLVTTGESQNKTFYWNITITNSGGDSFTTQFDNNNQTINRVHFEQCGTYTNQTANLTAYYESNLTRIDPFLFQATFDVWLGDGDIKRITTIDNTTVSEMDICIFPANRNFQVDGEILYNGATPGQFIPRNYFFELEDFNTAVKNTSLFLLESGASTSFIIFVRDQTLQPVPGALVYTERYYPGTNTYAVVQVGETSDVGKTVGFFVTETVDYRFRVIIDGEEELLTNKQKIVGESAPFTITLTIGEGSANPLLIFEGISNLEATLVYNNDTDMVVFTYEDTSGNFSSARLLVERQKYSSVNTVICNVTSTSTANVLTCDVSAFEDGTFIAQAFISRSPEILQDAIQFVKDLAKDIFGTTGLFLAWFIILTTAMTMIWNPTVGIIGVNVAVILVNLIGMASFPPLTIFALIALSITIIILMET